MIADFGTSTLARRVKFPKFAIMTPVVPHAEPATRPRRLATGPTLTKCHRETTTSSHPCWIGGQHPNDQQLPPEEPHPTAILRWWRGGHLASPRPSPTTSPHPLRDATNRHTT